MEQEIIRNMETSRQKVYYILPYWHEDNKLSYVRYEELNLANCEKDAIIKVIEYDCIGYKGISGCCVPAVERNYVLEFLGAWSPKLLDRDGSYIKRNTLFISPKIKITISSLDTWGSFTREQWKDVNLWNRPRQYIELIGKYNYYDVDEDGIGDLVQKELNIEFSLGVLDPIEASIYSVLFLDDFASDEFEPNSLVSLINCINKSISYPGANMPSNAELIMVSHRLMDIYEKYPFISLKFKENLKDLIEQHINYNESQLSILKRQSNRLDYID